MKISEQRDELEKMIENSDERIDKNVVPRSETATPELKMEPTFDLDFEGLRKECDGKAKKMIQTAIGFVLSAEILKQNPYLKNKMQVDIISLSGMLYQLKVNELMQETLMKEVQNGATHNRMFEVFWGLSKTIGELNKQLLQTVEAIKSTYRDIKSDIREKAEELRAIGPSQNGLVRNDRGLISLGTKELINETKKLKSITEIKIDEVQIIKE